MKFLYLYLNIGSFLIPFLFSFHPKLKFYRKWKYFFPATAIMMIIFITWDVLFTNAGIWGFNDAYISGYKILNLPIEEWLFFICIPYACLFTHYSLLHFFPKMAFSKKTTSLIYIILLLVLIITLWYSYDRWYTLVNFSYAILVLAMAYNYQRRQLEAFLPTFLVILLPFLIVNGVLTGSGIEEQVVWYNNSENLGIRMFTIPVEDTFYALGMLLTVFLLMNWMKKRKRI